MHVVALKSVSKRAAEVAVVIHRQRLAPLQQLALLFPGSVTFLVSRLLLLPFLDLLLFVAVEFLLQYVGAGKRHERQIAPGKNNNALRRECFPVTALMCEQ